MSDLLTHVARLEMVDVDLDLEPQCELVDHGDVPRFHSGPAAYLAVSPCKQLRLVCATFVKAVIRCGDCWCANCNNGHAAADMRFIEL